MTALFALATSLLWGLADFGGGLLTRRTPALTVVVVSQSIAAVVLGAIVVATGGWSEAGPQLWFAVAAGVVGPVAMLSFYKALALGPMGVVSPLGSLGVAVPISVGLFLGERPGPAPVRGHRGRRRRRRAGGRTRSCAARPCSGRRSCSRCSRPSASAR